MFVTRVVDTCPSLANPAKCLSFPVRIGSSNLIASATSREILGIPPPELLQVEESLLFGLVATTQDLLAQLVPRRRDHFNAHWQVLTENKETNARFPSRDNAPMKYSLRSRLAFRRA